MSDVESWPPKSAHAAQLSSPSGRRTFMQDGLKSQWKSPIKRSQTTPSLLDQLRAARTGIDHPTSSDAIDEEDDEETLQLQLAAIEAKLKLKKIQQNKARAECSTPLSPPPSTRVNLLTSPKKSAIRNNNGQDQHTDVEVAMSPVRRPPPPIEPRSPSRILLGIDKGIRGSEISLRRANTNTNHSKRAKSNPFGRPASSSSTRNEIGLPSTKSFSEKMAQLRDTDKAKETKREKLRSTTFKLDKHEMDSLRQAAEGQSRTIQPVSPTKTQQGYEFSRDQVLQAKELAKPSSRGLHKSLSMPSLYQESLQSADSSLYEGYSQLHLSSRILPHSFLKRTLPDDQYTTYKIPDLLKVVTAPAYELPDEVGDFVVFGIIAKKTNPLDQKQTRNDENSTDDWNQKWEDGSNNQKKFIVMTLTDLKWSIDLFLFGTAVPRYHRLSPGTVVAILNPTIMPPKKGREHTNAFSLSLHNGEDTVLEIGQSQHLAYCSVTKKNGQPCGEWIDSIKTEICEFHLNLQMTKTQASRMGVNAGTNGFGGRDKTTTSSAYRFGSGGGGRRGGLKPDQTGPRYDSATGSQFFIAPSHKGHSATPQFRSNMRATHMHHLGAAGEDPYIAEGQFSRDREATIQRRLVAQEKERQIAKKLSAMGAGGAGGEYLRHKTGGDVRPSSSSLARGVMSGEGMQQQQQRSSALATKSNILGLTALGGAEKGVGGNSVSNNGNSRKRTAENVRLSPVKKTRFVTEKGIRVAGRESLGGVGNGNCTSNAKINDRNDDDDDDELDII